MSAPTLNDRARQLAPPHAAAALRALWPVAGAIAAAAAIQLVLMPVIPDFYSKILLDIAISVVLAVSLTMVNGFTGQFSIGHAAFMAVGGYTAAAIVYYGSYRFFGDPYVHGGRLSTLINGREAGFIGGGDLLFLVALVAGGLVSAVCGYVVGLPSLRLRGDYLAIVTLGFGEIVRIFIQSQTTDTLADGAPVTAEHLETIGAWRNVVNADDPMTAELIGQVPVWLWPRFVGGSVGFSGLPFYASLFWGWLAAFLTVLVAFRLKYSTHGRAFLAIREDEIAAEAMGVHTTRYKVWAFVLAAFFAGIAGGLYAHTVGVQLNAGELGFQRSFDIIIMVVLGGLGSISGAVIAAAILTIMPELLRQPPGIWPWGIVLGVIIAVPAWLLAARRWRAVLGIAAALGAWELLRLAAVWGGIDLSRYRMILYALLLIVMMIARPGGLLGVGEIWDAAQPRRRSPAKGTPP